VVENVTIPEPDPPGPWIDVIYDDDGRLVDIACICGAHLGTYRKFNSGVTFDEAADYVREVNQVAEVAESQGEFEYRPHLTGGDWHDEAPGGWRSRGPVLWAMHVLKMEAFYKAHSLCPADDWDWDEFCSTYPDSETCHGFEEWLALGRPESSAELKRRRKSALSIENDDDDWIPF